MNRYILVLLALLFSFGVNALTVNVIPNKASYQVGDIILLSVVLSESPPIHGGGLNINFNPTVLQAQSVAIDSVWGFANRSGVVNNAAGSINDILFSSYNAVEGDLPVGMIQLVVIGDGNSALTVTESSLNPFRGANGQAVSFSVHNLFAFNTQVAEQPVETTTEEQLATQTTPEKSTESVSQTDTSVTTQSTEQTTTIEANVETTTSTTNTNNYVPAFSNSVGLPKNASNNERQAVNQNDRQFFLPSGPGAIPIKITDDNAVAERTDTASRNKTDNWNNEQESSSDDIDESSTGGTLNSSDESSTRFVSESQQYYDDDADQMKSDSSNNFLTYVIIFTLAFGLFILYKVFYKK